MPEDVDLESGDILDLPRTPAVQPRMIPLASMDAGVDQVCAALAQAQGEFDAPKRTNKAKISGVTRNGREFEYEYSYAPLEEIIRSVQKPMADAGLSRQQYLVSRGGQWFVRTIIWHLSGQWISSDYPIFPEANTGPKFAAAVTYAKRQGLSLAVCIAPEDDLDAEDVEPVSAAATKARRAPPLRAVEPLQPPPPAPPHDPRSGEILPPREIPPRTGPRAWIEWGSSFVAAIKTASSEAELNEWRQHNAPQIAAMLMHAPKAHASIKHALEAQEAIIAKATEAAIITEADAPNILQQMREGSFEA